MPDDSTTSTAIPSETRHGIGELVRTWKPPSDPWAQVLIAHGIAEHSGFYETVGSAMAREGLAVRSFDFIGFGASGGRRGDVESWTMYLDQIEDNLGALSDDLPRVLFGHSMGGLVSLEYALSARPPVDVLVLRAPALSGGAAWQRLLAPIMAKVAPTLPIPQAIKGSQLSRDPAVGEAYFADPLLVTKATPRLGNDLFQAMSRVIDNLSALKAPTLVLHGGGDTLVPPQSSAVLGTLLTVERRLLVGLRHEPHNEPEGPDVISDTIAWIRETVDEL